MLEITGETEIKERHRYLDYVRNNWGDRDNQNYVRDRDNYRDRDNQDYVRDRDNWKDIDT